MDDDPPISINRPFLPSHGELDGGVGHVGDSDSRPIEAT
jgi:hypothetical protein